MYGHLVYNIRCIYKALFWSLVQSTLHWMSTFIHIHTHINTLMAQASTTCKPAHQEQTALSTSRARVACSKQNYNTGRTDGRTGSRNTSTGLRNEKRPSNPLTSFLMYSCAVVYYILYCSLEAHLLCSAYPQDALKYTVRGCLRKLFSYVIWEHIMCQKAK